MTNKTKQKISKALKGRKAWNKGLKTPEEVKAKLRKINLGKKHTEETKRKIGESQLGEKNHQWCGGIALSPYPIYWTKTLKQAIRQRDNYTCKICGIEPATEVHHIDYNKDNCNLNNLITLCRSCHSKTNGNREYWRNYFE